MKLDFEKMFNDFILFVVFMVIDLFIPVFAGVKMWLCLSDLNAFKYGDAEYNQLNNASFGWFLATCISTIIILFTWDSTKCFLSKSLLIKLKNHITDKYTIE